MTLVVDAPAEGIRRLRIDRPDARNAIDAAVRAALLEAIPAARDDPAVRALVIGGTNGAFSAGGDLPSMIGLSADAALARMKEGHRVVEALWTFPKPVVIALERFAVGAAAGIAMLADRIVMGRTAIIGLPFLKLGLIPDWGLMATLPRRTGPAAGERLFAEAANVSGGAALALGLADEIAEDEAVMDRAIEVASRLMIAAPGAFARLKAAARPDVSVLGLAAEARDQVACLGSAEFAEGYAAFRERRAPDFKGKA